MESDKRYFIEGLFIIGFTVAAALFAVWLGSPGSRDDVLYRIHFAESVSGLAVGDPVKFHGVDVGTRQDAWRSIRTIRARCWCDVQAAQGNAGQDRYHGPASR